ncbi:hypothetical protein I551_8041 [Mycobacterium ulcerans str. Harvey]|uniref:Uncharacterized protein n=1 Tax=Mycobacterium ulcerans str. Harvey TaxID=1299332 RepID=A0ABN0QLP3_MYCUL|nr:hypothetical protein I551_8041 [Mycobacterium ulcerans str. Harvey]
MWLRARFDLPATPWLIPESTGLELLYRMADFCRPDWVMMVDADWLVETDIDVRAALARTPEDVAALLGPIVSSWDDPEYPELIPVMGTAEALRGPFWRWSPGLRAGIKLMHNPHWPANITDHGRIGRLEGSGWCTTVGRRWRSGSRESSTISGSIRITGTTSGWPTTGPCCSVTRSTRAPALLISRLVSWVDDLWCRAIGAAV